MTSPNDAVREELLDALRHLAEFLRREGQPDYIRLTDAVLHTWALFRLVELDESTCSIVEQVLESLSRELNADSRLDTDYHAQQLDEAATRL